jgi:hypothetical protein
MYTGTEGEIWKLPTPETKVELEYTSGIKGGEMERRKFD